MKIRNTFKLKKKIYIYIYIFVLLSRKRKGPKKKKFWTKIWKKKKIVTEQTVSPRILKKKTDGKPNQHQAHSKPNSGKPLDSKKKKKPKPQ